MHITTLTNIKIIYIVTNMKYINQSTNNFLDTYKNKHKNHLHFNKHSKYNQLSTNIVLDTHNTNLTNIKVIYILTTIQVHSQIHKQFHSYTLIQSIHAKSQQFNKHKNHLHSKKYFKQTHKSTSNFLNTYKYNQLMQIASLTNIKPSTLYQTFKLH